MRHKTAAYIALAVILILLPIVAKGYSLFLSTQILIFALFALSFELIYGHTGMLSFGHAAFFGIGAYTLVWSITGLQVGPLLALGFAVLSGLTLAALVGSFAVRLRGHYFALITLIVGLIIYYAAVGWRTITNAEDGITFKRPSLLGNVDLNTPLHQYYFVLAVSILTFAALQYTLSSRLGRLFRAVRENQDRARYLGYPVGLLKMISFTLSGAIAALSGGLYALLVAYANVDFLLWTFSGKPVLWTFVGGPGTVFGPVLGAATLTVLEEWLSSDFIEIYPILLGGILILTIVFLPRGMVGGIQLAYRWAKSKFRA